MTTGSKLEQIETVHTADLNTGEISEGSDERRLLIVNNEGAPSLNPPPVPGLTLTSANLLGVLHLLNIGKGIEGLKEFLSNGSLLNVDTGLIGDNEGNFRDFVNGDPWPEPEQWRTKQPGRKQWRNAFDFCSPSYAIFCRSWWDRTFFLLDTCYQKLPDQHDEFLLQELEEYGLLHDPYPRILLRSDDQQLQTHHMLVCDSLQCLCGHDAQHLSERARRRLRHT